MSGREGPGAPERLFVTVRLWGPPEGHKEFERLWNCQAHLRRYGADAEVDRDLADRAYYARGICAFCRFKEPGLEARPADAVIVYIAPGDGPTPEVDTQGVLASLRRNTDKTALVLPRGQLAAYETNGFTRDSLYDYDSGRLPACSEWYDLHVRQGAGACEVRRCAEQVVDEVRKKKQACSVVLLAEIARRFAEAGRRGNIDASS